jgi:hypothetical protein
LSFCEDIAGNVLFGNENILLLAPVGGPIVLSKLGWPNWSLVPPVDVFEAMGARSNFAAAFSSFFFSRSARPPCRRSKPDIDLENVLAPGDSGVNEYSGCGFSGFVGCEFECAEDRGSAGCSSLSLFFCLERKLCRFSFSCAIGTSVEVEAFAEE